MECAGSGLFLAEAVELHDLGRRAHEAYFDRGHLIGLRLGQRAGR